MSNETSSEETAGRLRKATEMSVRWLHVEGTDDATVPALVMKAFRGAIVPGPLPVNVYESEPCVPLAVVCRIVFEDQGIDRQSF